MTVNLSLLSAGAVTAVGHDLPATAAAIRAAVDNFQETHFFDRNGDPLMGAKVRLEAQDTDIVRGGRDHLPRMFERAVKECMEALPPNAKVALLLLLADEDRPLDTVQVESDCLGWWHAEMGRTPTQTYRMGAIGCVPALQEAQRLLGQGTITHVLLAGVDSWLNTPSIQEALTQNRLQGEAGEGFLPGEGAAAVLVSASGCPSPVRICGLGTAEESATLFAEEVCYGKGLGKATGEALAEAGLQAHEIHLRMADISGESYFYEESAYAWARQLRQPQPAGHEFLLPTESTGEMGSPLGLLILGYTLHLARIRRGPGPHTLIQLSSTQPLRGAIACVSQG